MRRYPNDFSLFRNKRIELVDTYKVNNRILEVYRREREYDYVNDLVIDGFLYSPSIEDEKVPEMMIRAVCAIVDNSV